MSSLHVVTQQAFQPVENAILAGKIPGAVFGAVQKNGQRAVLSAGQAPRVPQHCSMTRETWFDFALLTKVLFTTVQVLEEAGRGSLDLDAPLTTLLPDFRQYDMDCWERKISFRQCLGHQTPFPAVEPLYTYGQDQAGLRAFILQREWIPGPKVYSDINFILLGLALERLRGKAVSEMNPGWGFSFSPPNDKCAATEACQWRGRMIRGEIHDENAFALGGAGHAGLFGKIDGVLDFAQDLLNGRGFATETIKLMRDPVSDTRTLGWERAHSGWSGGSHCNGSVIGHTGFTGTGLWIDFESERAWSLLTNRVHPTRHTQSDIVELRCMVADVFQAQKGEIE